MEYVNAGFGSMLFLSISHSRALHHNFSCAFIVSISVVIEHSCSCSIRCCLLMNFHRFEIISMSLWSSYILFFSVGSKTTQFNCILFIFAAAEFNFHRWNSRCCALFWVHAILFAKKQIRVEPSWSKFWNREESIQLTKQLRVQKNSTTSKNYLWSIRWWLYYYLLN